MNPPDFEAGLKGAEVAREKVSERQRGKKKRDDELGIPIIVSVAGGEGVSSQWEIGL